MNYIHINSSLTLSTWRNEEKKTKRVSIYSNVFVWKSIAKNQNTVSVVRLAFVREVACPLSNTHMPAAKHTPHAIHVDKIYLPFKVDFVRLDGLFSLAFALHITTCVCVCLAFFLLWCFGSSLTFILVCLPCVCCICCVYYTPIHFIHPLILAVKISVRW